MSNGEVCCILGVCCPAGGTAQAHALDQMIKKSRPHMTQAEVESARTRVLARFDNFEGVAKEIDATT